MKFFPSRMRNCDDLIDDNFPKNRVQLKRRGKKIPTQKLSFNLGMKA